MEHRVIHNLTVVSGHRSLFRLWLHKFATALGHVKEPYEEIVRRVAREIDLGKELDVVMYTLQAVYGEVFYEGRHKAEAEAYDKIKMTAP